MTNFSDTKEALSLLYMLFSVFSIILNVDDRFCFLDFVTYLFIAKLGFIPAKYQA